MDQALSESQMPAVLHGLPATGTEPGDVDPALMEVVLADHREDVFLPVVAAHRGRPGTRAPLSAAFDTAVDALACALAIQSRTAEWNAGLPEDCRPLFRWTVTREDEVVEAASPARDLGTVAMSPAIEAEVEATDHFLPPPDRTASPSPDATVIAVASGATARPAGSSSAAPEPTAPGDGLLQPGGLLNGTYEIAELVASGGMGEVFRGREVHSGGEVAVKVIRLDMVHHPSALSLFQKEALVLRDINHDAIVRYFSFSFDAALRRHYLVMEFVDGPPLSRVSEGRPMPAETVALLARRVASGLQLAHERGIIHRDLSPDNIILPHGDAGHAKIIDFGIARAAQIGGGTIINGGFAGKLSYVSPEHLGLAGGEVTAKSDIYSLGIVLAEVCLGRQLDMAGTHVELIEKRRRVPDLSEVDPRLRGLIARMLDPDPERRPESMAAVVEAAVLTRDPPPPTLASAKADSPPDVARRDAPEPPRRPPQTAPQRPRRIERWIIGGGLAGALALGAGLFAFASLSGDRPPPGASAALQGPVQGDPQQDAQAHPSAEDAIPPMPGAEKPPSLQDPGPAPSQTATLEPPPAAVVPPAVPTAPPEAASVSPSQAMADYVKSYDGGGCFFLRPIRLAADSAALDAFAGSRDAFDRLDRSFQDRFRISPDIVGRQVWSRQCPALDFLRQTARAGAIPPQLFVRSARVGKGQPLAGEIRAVGGRAVTLLMVGENGGVRDVTNALKPDGAALTFEITPTPETAGPAPELLLAIASPTPLAPLGNGGSTPAETAFRGLLDAAARSDRPLAADAKLFIAGG